MSFIISQSAFVSVLKRLQIGICPLQVLHENIAEARCDLAASQALFWWDYSSGLVDKENACWVLSI